MMRRQETKLAVFKIKTKQDKQPSTKIVQLGFMVAPKNDDTLQMKKMQITSVNRETRP